MKNLFWALLHVPVRVLVRVDQPELEGLELQLRAHKELAGLEELALLHRITLLAWPLYAPALDELALGDPFYVQ